MKKQLIFIAIALITYSFSCYSQENSNTEEAQLLKEILGKTKKDFVLYMVDIPTHATTIFNSLYNDYESVRKKLSKDRIRLINKYVALFDTDDYKENNKFMRHLFKLRKKEAANLKKYYTRIKENVSQKAAMQFFHLEQYIRTSIDLALYENLPLKQ